MFCQWWKTFLNLSLNNKNKTVRFFSTTLLHKIWAMYLLRRIQLTVIKHLFLEFKFFNMTTIKNLHFWNSSSCCSILPLTRTFCSFWNHSLQCPITRCYLIEKSVYLLSPRQLKHSLCQTICASLKW